MVRPVVLPLAAVPLVAVAVLAAGCGGGDGRSADRPPAITAAPGQSDPGVVTTATGPPEATRHAYAGRVGSLLTSWDHDEALLRRALDDAGTDRELRRAGRRLATRLKQLAEELDEAEPVPPALQARHRRLRELAVATARTAREAGTLPLGAAWVDKPLEILASARVALENGL